MAEQDVQSPAAANGDEAASDVIDPMAGICAPAAVVPSKRKLAEQGPAQLEGVLPNFSENAEELLEFQTVMRKLQDITARGRRLCRKFTSQLHREESGLDLLQELREMETPSQAVPPHIWSNPQKRQRLCDAAQVPGYIECYISALGFSSFLERGVLMPEFPEEWQLAISNQDDECYLCGIIDTMREVERFAVNRGKNLDLDSIHICLHMAQVLEQALMQFDFRNSELRRRFDSIKYISKRLETLAYEVDLAIKRSAEHGGAESEAKGNSVDAPEQANSVAASTSGMLVVDLKRLGAIKERYDIFDKMRDETIKQSRDVTKAAKNAIYALQRGDYRKADADLKQSQKVAAKIYKEFVVHSPTLRGGSFSCAMEEMVEALTYRAFRSEWRVLSCSEVQQASGLDFELTLSEYLGGLMDLTGEVGRFAIRSASRGRQAVPDVERCLACVDSIYAGLQDLPTLPGGIGKKMGPLKGTLGKVENVLYELALLTRGGVRAQPVATGEHDTEEVSAL